MGGLKRGEGRDAKRWAYEIVKKNEGGPPK